MNLLIQYMIYLLLVHSIDDIDNRISTKNPESDIKEDEKDFDYNDLTIEEISLKKIPFINCNRKVFCNSDIDLIYLVRSTNIDINMEIFGKYNMIVETITFIQNVFNLLLSNDLNFKNIRNFSRENIDALCNYIASVENYVRNLRNSLNALLCVV